MKTKPIIGITIGDYNSISIEIILKAILHKTISKMFTPVIFANDTIIKNYQKKINFDIKYNLIESSQDIKEGFINVFHIHSKDTNIEMGKITKTAGIFALKSLMEAIKEVKNKNIDSLVTAPLNKSNIKDFCGHTYLLEREFDADTIMLMINDNLRIALITEHIAIKDIHKNIKTKKIQNKLSLLKNILENDFRIKEPKIAFLGLNPHCSDNGRFGDEEKQIILPIIKKNDYLFGAFPADSFFCLDTYKKFDAIVANYHDQGLIPFKILSKNKGVNYTGGLNIVRTSPAHGTAMDIAGKAIANEQSMVQAILQNIKILKTKNII